MIRPRRSLLFMPGSNARALEKARNLAADCLILDLEDSVAPDAKSGAREQIAKAVGAKGFGKREVLIRTNSLDTSWWSDDVAMAGAVVPDGILVPKVSTVEVGPAARRGRPVPVAPRRRVPPVQPRDRLPAPARHPVGPVRHLQEVHHAGRRAERAALHPPRPVRVQARRVHAGADRGGRAGRVDRQAVRHRGDVLRLDQRRGARDPGHRHEPDGRQEQHRRRGRGPRAVQAAAQRRQQAERDQAGGLGPVRRDQRIPGQRRRAPDQDGAGGQARRGGPAPRPQGLALDRQGPATRRPASA